MTTSRSRRGALALALLQSVLALGAAACGRPFTVSTPPGFIDLSENYPSDEYRAASADGAVFGVRAFENEPRGELAFWTRAIENRLRDEGYALLEKRDIKSRSGLRGTELVFGHDVEQNPHLYRLAVFLHDDDIFLVEAGGKKELLQKLGPSLDAAFRSVRAD